MPLQSDGLLPKAKPLLRDGAMATELERAGVVMHPTLWSAEALLTNASAIARVHQNYVDAGADVLTTATYQCSAKGFANAGYSHADYLNALRTGVRTAMQVRDSTTRSGSPSATPSDSIRPLKIFAGVGSVGASLADGSEFTAAYTRTTDEYVVFHEERIHVLAAEGVDALLLETMPRLDEVLVAAGIAMSVELPTVIMFSIGQDGRLPDGNTFEQAAHALSVFDAVVGVGVNCCSPTRVLPALRALRGATARPLAAVPNRCDHWLADERRWETGHEHTDWQTIVPAWLDLGMGLLGGCCHTRPQDIRELRAIIVANSKGTDQL